MYIYTYIIFFALRSTAQLISYELILSSAILLVILFTGSLNLTVIIEAQKPIWFIVPLFPVFIIFFIGALAETNRAPMDLAEAERWPFYFDSASLNIAICWNSLVPISTLNNGKNLICYAQSAGNQTYLIGSRFLREYTRWFNTIIVLNMIYSFINILI